jgi:hypothetical protein
MFKINTEDFNKKIESILNCDENNLKKSREGIHFCNITLSYLKKNIEHNTFDTASTEIDFFKNIKTVPMSYLIYFTEVHSCELRKPKAGRLYQIEFLEKEMKKINKFFYRNVDFVNYMEQESTYLDHQFFTRNHKNLIPLNPTNDYYQYPEFSTSHDMVWAKVKAMDHFVNYIREAMQKLNAGNEMMFEEKKHKVLVWTAPKTAITELIYALYSNGSLNNGAADINTITASFEDFFNIKLDNIYKTYSEIKGRKNSKTRFLEELMLNLQHKINKEDEF